MIDPQKIFGILGLILIIIGILVKPKNRNIRDVLYIIGGLFLLIYSVTIKDTIFIILQSLFIIVAIYDIIRIKTK